MGVPRMRLINEGLRRNKDQGPRHSNHQVLPQGSGRIRKDPDQQGRQKVSHQHGHAGIVFEQPGG